VDPSGELRQPNVHFGPQLGERVPPAQVMEHDRLVPGEETGAVDEVVEVQVSVRGALAALPLADEGALDEEDAALGDARRALPEADTGVAAVGEPDLFVLRLHALAGEAQRLHLGAREVRELGPELAPPAEEMETEAGHDVVGGERLEGEIGSELDPVAGEERHDLDARLGALEARRRGGERREVARDLARAVDGRRGDAAVDRALRQQVRQPEGVVEVAVREEDPPGAGELRRPAPGVERETWRVETEPGLFAGDRAPLDRELAVPEGVGALQISW
jgi:hypothetical protein